MIEKANDGIIKPCYGKLEIVFALKHISNQLDEERFELDLVKM